MAELFKGLLMGKPAARDAAVPALIDVAALLATSFVAPEILAAVTVGAFVVSLSKA